MLRELMQKDRHEETIKESDRKFKELLKRSEELDAKEEELLRDLGVSAEEMERFLSNPDHHTEEEWTEIQEQLATCDKRIDHILNSRRDRAKLQKAYNERGGVQRHWLFVR